MATEVFVIQGRYLRLKTSSVNKLVDYLLACDPEILEEIEIMSFQRNDLIKKCSGAAILAAWERQQTKSER
jgi:hypothetical protein